VTETVLYADGTQRFNLGCRQPNITVFPNGTKTYAYGNGTFETVQLPQNPVISVDITNLNSKKKY
jgi:hypothetical protein